MAEERLPCQQIKSIFSLKQAANANYKDLTNFFLRQRYLGTRTITPRSHEQRQETSKAYTDDFIVSSKSVTFIFNIMKAVGAILHVEDMGDYTVFWA